MKGLLSLLPALVAACAPAPGRAGEAARLQQPAPPLRIQYGPDAQQFGDLRLPPGRGPHPLALVLHGGCWSAETDLGYLSGLAAALTAAGVATFSLEYRRVGDPGGGWPGTFQDVAQGADFVRVLAQKHPLDRRRVIAVGHSAGGQLALWLAARSRLAAGDPLRGANPLPLRGVLGLAPAPDLALLHRMGVCGQVIDRLMGGSPAQHPDRYARGSPMALVPLSVPQVLIIGALDASWAPIGLRYYEVARGAGAPVRLVTAPQSGHFEMVEPASTTWPLVREAALQLLGPRR